MLSDFGQSGVAFVGTPVPMDSLPGYGPWARGEQGTEPVLYAQTNDGILHQIDPMARKEWRSSRRRC